MKVEAFIFQTTLKVNPIAGMKRFSLQGRAESNCMLSARFLWYKAIIIKPFYFSLKKVSVIHCRTKHFSNFVFEEVFTLIN